MINIKSYAKAKQNQGGSGSGIGGYGFASQSVINQQVVNSSTDDWFYQDSSGNVHCRYTLGSDYDVFAYGLNNSSDYGPGGGGCDCIVIDNLLSDSSTSCLSANQGRILADMIGNIDVSIDVSALTTQIQQNFVRKPVVLYETDGTTGLLGVNKNQLGENWQLEGYDFSPYQYLRCYIKMADQSISSNALTPAMIIELPLDEAVLPKSANDSTSVSPKTPCEIYVAGGSACNPSDQNRVFNVLVAVDKTKTKFQVVCENSLYGTAQTNRNTDGRYLYKIEGCYDPLSAAVESDFVETDPVFIASAAHNITNTDLQNYNDASNLRHHHSNLPILNSLDQTDLDHWDLAYDKAHDHENLSLLNSITASQINLWNNAGNNAHSHANKSILDNIKQIDINNYNDSSNLRHSHPNKNVLDQIDQESLDSFVDAADQAHTHNNFSILQNITSTKVSHWDLAYSRSHTHQNKSILDGITNSSIAGWDHVNDWFYQDSSGRVHSRFLFVGDDEIVAFNYGDGGSGGGGQGQTIEIIDNLDSFLQNAALSANQGRILKGMINSGLDDLQDQIDNLVIQGETSHVHANLQTLNLLTARTFQNFVDASNLKHEHTNKSLLDSLTSTQVNKWNSYESEIESLDDKIDNVSSGLNTKINNVSTNLNTQIDNLDDKIDNVSSGLNTKIDNVSSGLSTKINNVSTRLKNTSTNLGNRITNISSGLIELSNTVNNISTALNVTNTSVNILESSVLSLDWLRDAFYMQNGNIHAKYSFIGDYEVQAYQGNDSGGEGGGSGTSVEVIDNLDSFLQNAALSANQGRVLKGMINSGLDDLQDQIDNLVISGESSHTHANLQTLNKLTAGTFQNFVDASNLRHSHANKDLIDSLTSTQVNLWNGYQDQIDDLSDEIGEVSTRLKSVSTNVNTLNTKVNNVSTRLNSVSTNLNDVSARCNDTSSRLSSLYTTVENVSTRLVSVENNIDDLIDSIEDVSSDLNSKINNVSSGLHTKINNVSSNLNNKIDNVSSGLHTKIDNVSTDLNSKITSVSTGLNTKIEEVSTRLKNTSTNLGNKITNVSTRLNNVSTRLAVTNTSVNILESSVLDLDWLRDAFYMNNGNIYAKYNLYGLHEIIAHQTGEDSGGEGGGSGQTIEIIDTLTSTLQNAALSANQGRVLKGLIDSSISDIQDQIDNLIIQGETSHVHANLQTLNQLTAGTFQNFVDASNLRHSHSNSQILSGITNSSISQWQSGYTYRHNHSNKVVLDKIKQADLDNFIDSSNLRHTHSNYDDLETITGSKIQQWDGYNTSIANLNTSVNNLNTSINSLKTTVNSHTTSISSLTTRIQNVSTRLADVSTRLAGSLTSISNINSSINGLKLTVNNHTTQLSVLNTDFTDLNERVMTNETDISSLKSRVQHLEEWLDETADYVADLAWLNDLMYMQTDSSGNKYLVIKAGVKAQGDVIALQN